MRSLALLLLLVVGCSAKTPTPAAKAATPDAAPAVSPLVVQYRTKVAAHRGLTCLRPPLRGAATEGPARDHLLSLVEPKAAVATCIELAKGADDLKSVLDVTQPVDSPDTMSAVTERIQQHCGMIPELVARAVAHEDACSPYLAGTRDVPAGPTMIRVGRILPVLARDRAREGKTADALRLLFDGVRLGDDLRRGPTDLMVAMVATVVSRMPLNVAEAILNSAPLLAAADLDALVGEADALLATVPGFGEALAGERVAAIGLILMKDGQEQPLDAKTLAAMQDHDDAMALIEAACPAAASLAACRDGLAKATAKINVVSVPGFEKYLAKQAESLAHRAALRIDLELRRQGCDGTKLSAALLMPVALGEAMSVIAKPKTKGVWEIHYAWNGTDAVVWETHCGKKK